MLNKLWVSLVALKVIPSFAPCGMSKGIVELDVLFFYIINQLFHLKQERNDSFICLLFITIHFVK